MVRIILTFLAFFFPWTVFLIEDEPGLALASLFLQLTVIGWPVASMWAIKEVRKRHPKGKKSSRTVPPEQNKPT